MAAIGIGNALDLVGKDTVEPDHGVQPVLASMKVVSSASFEIKSA